MPQFSTFSMPRRVLIGAGSIAELPAEILRLKSDRVLVVTDKYLSATEMFRKILQNLQTKAIEADCLRGRPT
jgi:alcohol dehydrogenase class IV